MRLKLAAFTAVILIALVSVAAVIAVRHFDARALAQSVAASIKHSTGRELAFGEVGVTVFPRPAIRLSDVHLGNAAWGSQPWMAAAPQAEADVDVLALLSGRLHITRLIVTDASLLLETDQAGNGNWVMGTSAGGLMKWPSGLQIDALEFEPLAVTWRDGAGGRTLPLLLDTVTLHAPATTEQVRFEAHGSVAGTKADVTGSAGALAALVADGAAYPVGIEGQLGTVTFVLRGAVDQPLELGGLHLDVAVQGREASDVAALIGEKLPPLGSFRGTARVTGTLVAPSLSDIAVDIGAPERLAFTARGGLEATVSDGRIRSWSSAGLELSAQGVQISDLAHLFGKSMPSFGHYRIAAQLSGPSEAPSLSDIDLAVGSAESVRLTARGAVGNVRAVSGVDLQVTAGAPDWWYPGKAAGGLRLPSFHLSTRLRDAPGGYRSDGLELKIAGGTVKAALAVSAGGVRPRITAKVSSPAIDLARLAAPKAVVAGAPVPPGGYWQLADLDLDLQVGQLTLADGRVVQALAGRVSLADGQVRAAALQATLGGARVRCDGVITDPARMSGLNVNFSLQGDELADLFQLAGHPIPSVGPYKGSARALGSLQTLQLTAIEATAGKSGQRLRATGQISDTLNWQGLDLILKADISDSVAFGRLFRADVPHLPRVRVSARMTGPEGGYVFDDLKFAMPRTAVQGRLVIASAAPRPRVTATLRGPLVDLAELPAASQPSTRTLLQDTDLTADVRFDRVMLVDKRVLGPVSGNVEITAGEAVLRQLTVGVDGATATVNGRVAEPLRQAGLDLAVTMQINRVAGLRAFTSVNLPDLAPLAASGQVTDVPEGYAVSKLKLASGDTEITGDFAVARGASRLKLTAKLTSPLLDLEALEQAWPDRATAAQATAQARIFSDAPLPLELLRSIDADVEVRVDRLRLSDAEPLGPLTMHAVLADGRLRADPVQIGIGRNQFFAVTGDVDTSRGRAARWSFTLTGSSINIGDGVKRFGAKILVTGGVSDFTLEGTGHGNSVRAILGSFTGSARLKGGPAVVRNPTDNRSADLLANLLGLVNPFRNTDPETNVKCVAILAPIKDGIVTLERAAAAETTKFNVVVSGTIDLRTEAIDLFVVPILTQGFGTSNRSLDNLVRVSGTLANPRLEANVAGTATRGALSLGAAYLTFGGSWLVESLLNLASKDPHPCSTALRE